MKSSKCFTLCCALALAGLATFPALASGTVSAEISPVFSERTLVVGLQFDRDEVKLVSYTLKPREFVQPTTLSAAPRAHDSGGSVQAEVVLHGYAGRRYTRRIEAGT